MAVDKYYISEEANELVCYGKSYDELHDDCRECSNSIDCESLTAMRKKQKKTRVARMPSYSWSADVEEEGEYREEREGHEVPWNKPQQPEVPLAWLSPQSYPHMQQTYPQTPTTYVNPGWHCSAQVIPHPAPHLTYMVSNPVDCPMPTADEQWYIRCGKNVLTGMISEGGRQIYEYFRRFRL